MAKELKREISFTELELKMLQKGLESYYIVDPFEDEIKGHLLNRIKGNIDALDQHADKEFV